MSFNCAEQRKQDLMQLTERVVSVAPLARGLKAKELEKEELEARLEALEEEIQEGNDEMNEYLIYAGSVGFVNEELLREMLSRVTNPDCSDDEFYGTLIVILNSNCYDVSIEDIAYEYAEQVEDDERKFVLQNFAEYQVEDICKLITENS